MSFENKNGGMITDAIILAIHENKQYLSNIDGAIGDGDHGINMSKGMSIAQQELLGKEYSMSEGLKVIQNALMNKIGGSMGPLYGMVFRGFVSASQNAEKIDEKIVGQMLHKAYDSLMMITEAKVGDKTLLDVLYPAMIAYDEAIKSGKCMSLALQEMVKAADEGVEDTKNMIARVGRASRLGEKSKGHQDAGSTSCAIILKAMAEAMCELEEKSCNDL